MNTILPQPLRTSEPFVSTAKDSPAYWLLNILWVVHATGEQTEGRYSVIEQWMPEGSGPPPHVHPFEDEFFWVMEGELTVEVGGKTLVLGPGSLGHIPRNTVHSFKVTSKAVCHVLNSYTPAGLVRQWQSRTPAMVVGLTDHRWALREVLGERLPPVRWKAPRRKPRRHRRTASPVVPRLAG